VVPTREQVRELLGEGLDYADAGRRLGIPAGQAYLIATGLPADGSEATEDPGDAHDAVAVLTRQHNQVRVLLKQLQAPSGHSAGGSPGQVPARKSLVDTITARLSEHEAIEEEHFWPQVRRALPDGDELADRALEQEQEGKATLAELGKLDPDSREFGELAERLAMQLRKHVAYEERIFLRVRETVPPEELDALGSKLLASGRRASARPHQPAPTPASARAGAAGNGGNGGQGRHRRGGGAGQGARRGRRPPGAAPGQGAVPGQGAAPGQGGAQRKNGDADSNADR
jgi:hypothetical protein